MAGALVGVAGRRLGGPGPPRAPGSVRGWAGPGPAGPASSSPSPSPSSSPARDRGALAEERRAMLAAAPSVQLRVAGVSFEGRQEAVAALGAGDSLLLEREPLNPHDANAVHVATLNGQSIGYVPRDWTGLFRQPVALGFVSSAGQNEKGLHGCSIVAKPDLPPLTVDLTANSFGSARGSLPAPALAQLEAAARERSGGACSICGAEDLDEALDELYQPLEEESTGERTYRFVELRCLCRACRAVRGLRPGGALGPAGRAHLMATNRWTRPDVDAYLALAGARHEQRSRSAFSMDFSAANAV